MSTPGGFLLIPLVLVLVFATSCATYETQTTDGFSESAFARIANGMREEKVLGLLGEPFFTYTHIDYGPEGGSDNAVGRLPPESLKRGSVDCYVLRYSRPKRKYANFRVFEVFVSTSGIVTGKQTYLTD